MEDNRKIWIQPQLIVLGRGTPEENVLAGCKITTLSGAGVTVNKCKKKPVQVACGNFKCNAVTAAS